MSLRTHLSVAGFGLAGLYAAVGLVVLLFVGDWRAALTFAASAGVTAGLVALLLPLLAPRDGGDPGPGDGGGPGGGGPGGDPPSPPWWPEFERDFWSHVGDAPAGDRRGPPDRLPT